MFILTWTRLEPTFRRHLTHLYLSILTFTSHLLFGPFNQSAWHPQFRFYLHFLPHFYGLHKNSAGLAVFAAIYRLPGHILVFSSDRAFVLVTWHPLQAISLPFPPIWTPLYYPPTNTYITHNCLNLTGLTHFPARSTIDFCDLFIISTMSPSNLQPPFPPHYTVVMDLFIVPLPIYQYQPQIS